MLTENSFKILTGMILLCVLLFASERADQNSGKVNSKGASHTTGEHIQGGSDSESKKNNGKKRNLSGPVEIEKTPSVKMIMWLFFHCRQMTLLICTTAIIGRITGMIT